jgi:hypothetical protein
MYGVYLEETLPMRTSFDVLRAVYGTRFLMLLAVQRYVVYGWGQYSCNFK